MCSVFCLCVFVCAGVRLCLYSCFKWCCWLFMCVVCGLLCNDVWLFFVFVMCVLVCVCLNVFAWLGCDLSYDVVRIVFLFRVRV